MLSASEGDNSLQQNSDRRIWGKLTKLECISTCYKYLIWFKTKGNTCSSSNSVISVHQNKKSFFIIIRIVAEALMSHVTLEHGGIEIAYWLVSLSVKWAVQVRAWHDPFVSDRWNTISMSSTCLHQCPQLVHQRPSMCYHVFVIMHV